MGGSTGGMSMGELGGLMGGGGGGGGGSGRAQAEQLGMSALGHYKDMSQYSNPMSLMNMIGGANVGPDQGQPMQSNPLLQQQQLSPYMQSLMMTGQGG